MRSFLSVPSIYLLFQGLLGAKKIRRRSIEEYVDYSPGQRILDIGCGPGYVSEYFKGADYIGFDTDKAYVDYAKNRYSHHGRFFCQEFDDAAADQFGSFDRVIMNGLLHHLEDDTVVELLQRVKRVLKTGGKLVTLDGCYAEGQSFIARKLLFHDRGKHVREEEEYRALASKAFNSVVTHIRNDLMFIPYTFIIMQIS